MTRAIAFNGFGEVLSVECSGFRERGFTKPWVIFRRPSASGRGREAASLIIAFCPSNIAPTFFFYLGILFILPFYFTVFYRV